MKKSKSFEAVPGGSPQQEYLNQVNERGRSLRSLILQMRNPDVQNSRSATQISGYEYEDRADFKEDCWTKFTVSSRFSSDDDSESENENQVFSRRLVKGFTANRKAQLPIKPNENNCQHKNCSLCLLQESHIFQDQYYCMSYDSGRMTQRRASGENYVNSAITSRLIVLILQFFAFSVFPHHKNDGFRFTPEENYGTFLDTVINKTLSGLANWDGQYFLHIATKGYTEESMIAFFPLFPATVSIISNVCHLFTFPLLSFSSVALVVGVVLNIILFTSSVVLLYDVTKRCDRGLENLTEFVVLIYCYNPASIFFSAFYSESMFAFFTIYMCHFLLIRNTTMAVLMASLSSLCRSNGILNFGLIAAFVTRNTFCYKRSLASILVLHGSLVLDFLSQLLLIAIGTLPFFLFQLYGVLKFCDGREVTSDLPPYCLHSIPFVMPYQYVQKYYWNVGFLNYFEAKQIPNFVLAAPILFVTMFECSKRFRLYAWYIFKHQCYDCIGDFSMTVHGIFLTLFCFLCVHVQVSTRLILSACPYLFIYIAKTRREEVCRYRQQQIDFPLFSAFIYIWCFGYYLVGTVLFTLGLPWT